MERPRRRDPLRGRARASVPARGAVAAAAGRLDAQAVARAQRARRLRLELLAVEQVAPARAVLAAVGARRRVAAALGDQRVASSPRAPRSRARRRRRRGGARRRPSRGAPRSSDDAQRELELERLDRRVERVAHRDVDAARAVGVGARALAAAERLVVGEVARCRA